MHKLIFNDCYKNRSKLNFLMNIFSNHVYSENYLKKDLEIKHEYICMYKQKEISLL